MAVRCKTRTRFYASPAYSRVFPSIRRRKSIGDERRRGLSSSFPPCKWKVALPKDERGCNRESGSLPAVCSDESKGESLKALACPLRERLICECFTGISTVFILRSMKTARYKKNDTNASSWNSVNPRETNSPFIFLLVMFLLFMTFPICFFIPPLRSVIETTINRAINLDWRPSGNFPRCTNALWTILAYHTR